MVTQNGSIGLTGLHRKYLPACDTLKAKVGQIRNSQFELIQRNCFFARRLFIEAAREVPKISGLPATGTLIWRIPMTKPRRTDKKMRTADSLKLRARKDAEWPDRIL